MAKYSVSWAGTTMTAVNDASNFTDAGYCTFLQGSNSSQRLVVSEIYIGGEEGSTSNPTSFVFARDSTVAATAISGNSLALLDGSATAPANVPVYGNTSTTKPQRSSTSKLLRLSINCYGGVVRWVAAPGNEISSVGNTASLGELSLSASAGTGKNSGHIIFECV